MRKLLVLLLVVGLALAGVAYGLNRSQRSTTADFTLASVEHGSLRETVSATGILQPKEVLIVGSTVPGQVIEIDADFNQIVNEGDVLLRLDPRMADQDLAQAETGVSLARAGVNQAEAKRLIAQTECDRQNRLPMDVRSRSELEAAEHQLQAAEAGVEAAKAQLKKAEENRSRAKLAQEQTVVQVPYVERQTGSTYRSRVEVGSSGAEGRPSRSSRRAFVVLERKVELNQQIGPPMAAHLFTLAGGLDQMQIRAQVAEGDISKVAPGQEVDFTVSTYAEEDRHFSGKVAEVHLQPNTVQGAIFYEALIDVANQRDTAGAWRLRPGMTASVDIIRREHAGSWKVPVTALSFQLDEAYQSAAAKAKLARGPAGKNREEWQTLWILDSGRQPWPIFVRTGATDSQFREVLEWDPELSPKPDAGSRDTYPQVIIGAPPAKGGFFHSPIHL